MNKSNLFIKKHSGTILTCIASIGVVNSTFLAVKATPKAMELIALRKEELEVDELTLKETIITAWKPYIPTFVSSIVTILGIVSINHLNIKKQQSLTSAYVLLDSTFKEYRNKMENEYNISEDEYDTLYKKHADDENTHNEVLFFEFNSLKFFESTFYDVLQAETKALAHFETCKQLSLNEYFEYLGLEQLPYGDVVGWSQYQMKHEQHVDKGLLKFSYDQTIMSNGVVCYNITTNTEPTMDHFCF